MSSEVRANDDKTLTARDEAALIDEARRFAFAFQRQDEHGRTHALITDLADALAEAQQRIEAVKALHQPYSLDVKSQDHYDAVFAAEEAGSYHYCTDDACWERVSLCNGEGQRYPCRTIAALSSSTAPTGLALDDDGTAWAEAAYDAERGSSTASETGIGARQGGVNAVSDPEMGSTAPETETKPERCYHPSSNPLPGGRTVCRSCGVDTTHDDKMGG